MKTLNILPQLFLVIALSLTSILASANATNKTNLETTNELADAVELEIEIEYTMADIELWANELKVDLDYIESEIELENWMLTADEKNWEVSKKEEKEPEVLIEKWMFDLRKW